MIKLNLTSYQAIQLDALLNSLNLLSSSVGHLVAPGFSNNSELKDIAESLRSEFNSLVKPSNDSDKPKDFSNKIPRRNRLDMLVPSELAVWKAKQAVEELGCHPLLTEAVILLGQAQDKVSDYVDRSKTMKPEDESPIDKAAAQYWEGQLQ